MKVISLYAPDVAPDANAEEQPELSPLQLARRRAMAATLCASALNRTSATMAKRLCLAWFGKCEQCPYDQEVNALQCADVAKIATFGGNLGEIRG